MNKVKTMKEKGYIKSEPKPDKFGYGSSEKKKKEFKHIFIS